MTDYIEELDKLPSPAPKPKGRPGRRSHYIRTLIEGFIGSDATIWKVVKDYDGKPFKKGEQPINTTYCQAIVILGREYPNSGVHAVIRNGELFLTKED